MSASDRAHEALKGELGRSVNAILSQSDVLEILVNEDGRIWSESLPNGLRATQHSISKRRVESFISVLAGNLSTVVGPHAPLFEGELSKGALRVTGLLPPAVSAPVFSIRKRAAQLIPLDAYTRHQQLTPSHAFALRQALGNRRSIVISGGPGSGKTTFANALIHEMEQLAPATERFILIEDTYELRCEAENHVTLHTTEHVTLRDLVKVTLRLRPDRIIVGEVRGAEALDLLKAWNTGNPGGVTTVHANSAEDALYRLDQLAQEAGVPSQARLVASSVDMVVHMERRGSKRQVTELITVKPFKPQTDYIVEAIPAE